MDPKLSLLTLFMIIPHDLIQVGAAITCQRPEIKNGGVSTPNNVFARGDQVRVICDQDYYYPVPGSRMPPTIKCVKDLHWTLLDGQEFTARCKKYCPWPEPIKHATHTVEHAGYSRPAEGSTVTYFCKEGFAFSGSLNAVESKSLTCRNSQWVGDYTSRCVSIAKECDNPADITHGNWNYLGVVKKQVGGQIQYECVEGYILIGSKMLTCESNQLWSDFPPRCVQKTITCPSPPIVEHSTRYCNPPMSPCVGYVGVNISYVCDAPDYKPINRNGEITCLKTGRWSKEPHACVKVDNTSPSSNLSSDSSKQNTMTVAIATGSSILGVLLIVIVVVLIQRRKANSALWSSNTTPPPYTRQHTDSVDEHDRVALIAVAEGVRVVLPSYDEAVRGRATRSSLTSPHRNRANLEYRPLPRIPSGLRASGDLSIQSGPRDDTSSNHPSIGDSVSVRRQSTLTIGTNRDALSENFGSIDTMNVSDTSTAVTLGTYDSSASNPSLAAGSHKAAAGSLVDNEEDEDAPLLEGNDTSHSHAGMAACQNTHSDV